VEAIQIARRDGEFSGLGDFIRRVPGRSVNSRALTALVRSGAFDFGSRAALEANIPVAQKAAKAKSFQEPMLPDTPELPLEDILGYEHELLGFHLTPVPVAETVAKLEAAGRINATTLEPGEGRGRIIRLGGAVTGGREIQSRYGQMFIFNLNDGRGLMEVSVYPKVYRASQNLLKEGKLIVVEGKTEQHEGRVKLQANALEAAE
jgi:DNA polymerase III subunit alpha